MALNYYLTIAGQFKIEGYQPDGDSVRFIADNPALFGELYRGYKIKPSKKDGSVQLRLEGVDAPETHYGAASQPYGDVARDAFMQLLGFADLRFSANGKVVTDAKPPAIRGAILSKSADPHGRPIAYIVLDENPEDGATRRVDKPLLHQTLNYQMVAAGQAYGLFYSSMPPSHHRELQAAAKRARQDQKGLWIRDETPLFRLKNEASIGPDGVLIFPKLFRRCVDYLKVAGSARASYDLQDWLRENPNENDRLLVRVGDSAERVELYLDQLIEQRNSRIAFQADVLDIVFIEK